MWRLVGGDGRLAGKQLMSVSLCKEPKLMSEVLARVKGLGLGVSVGEVSGNVE